MCRADGKSLHRKRRNDGRGERSTSDQPRQGFALGRIEALERLVLFLILFRHDFPMHPLASLEASFR